MTRIEDMGFALEHEPHPSSGCQCWSEKAQALMDSAATLAEFDRIWKRLAGRGETDAWGGAEYRHGLAHLYYAHPETRPQAAGEAGGPEVISDGGLDEEEFTDEIVRAKWTIDGAATLVEAAQKAREFADFLQGLHDEGYVLREPVADDYGFYYKPEAE
jgi:hypothetical protein